MSSLPHFFEEMASDDLLFADIEMVITTGRIQRRFTRDVRGALLLRAPHIRVKPNLK